MPYNTKRLVEITLRGIAFLMYQASQENLEAVLVLFALNHLSELSATSPSTGGLSLPKRLPKAIFDCS
jgi:hypothetical protein